MLPDQERMDLFHPFLIFFSMKAGIVHFSHWFGKYSGKSIKVIRVNQL